MKKDIRTKYKLREECLTHANRKPAPHHEVTPTSLQLLQPNEVCHADFMTISNNNILVLKCKATGFIYARLSKDKKMEASTNIFHKFVTSYNRPRLVVTVGGPCFQGQFLEYPDSMYIQHHHSSAYIPQSDSPAERGVRSSTDGIEKMTSFNEKILRTVVFNVNNRIAQDGPEVPP